MAPKIKMITKLVSNNFSASIHENNIFISCALVASQQNRQNGLLTNIMGMVASSDTLKSWFHSRSRDSDA